MTPKRNNWENVAQHVFTTEIRNHLMSSSKERQDNVTKKRKTNLNEKFYRIYVSVYNCIRGLDH